MISWHRELETATSATEVVSLANAFVGEVDTHGLPRRCRPAAIHSEAELRAWSHALTDEYWAQRNAGADVGTLQDLWSFFLRAAVQLERVEDGATALG